MVVFPAPVSPTRATICPAGMRRSMSCRTALSRYANVTCSNASAPLIAPMCTGVAGSGTVGLSSMTPASFSSAAPAAWNTL